MALDDTSKVICDESKHLEDEIYQKSLDEKLEEIKSNKNGAASHSDTTDSNETDVLVETDVVKTKVLDGGWGWMIVVGCLLLRTVVGGIARSSGLFYVKFLERFGGTAAETAWVSSLSATVRLLTGPAVSVLCSRLSMRMLILIGAVIYIIAINICGYAESLLYMYFTYGVIGGIGRSLLLTPLTMLLGEYFDKRRSLAFGLASAGFGIGGFVITPCIEVMFQEYGFTGTYLILSGISCNLFVCICLFRPAIKFESKSVSLENESTVITQTEDAKPDNSIVNQDDGEDVVFLSYTSSSGSVHMIKEDGTTELPVSISNGVDKHEISSESKQKKSRKKLFSFSVLRDIRFVTLCIATFIFTLPSSGLFIPALAKSRGVTDIQTAALVSVIAGSDTVSRVIAGFVLDLKGARHLRPYIYNLMSFLQCISSFCYPSLQTFEHFIGVCVLHGFIMGTKAAQRNVILVDIIGMDNLSSSFAVLLSVQGLGTLIGPPLSAMLKDYYGKYDYSFYFGGSCIFFGALILAGGNIRNYFNTLKTKGEPGDEKD